MILKILRQRQVIRMRKFWNFAESDGVRELRLEGIIAEDSWFGDEVTPKIFRAELNAGTGDIIVWINSYGGDVFAASQIYTALKEYSGGVEVKIDGIAASAASVIAMAGDIVSMAPTAVMMLHNPATVAIGDTAEMRAAIKLLDEIKESIVTAYALKTKLPRDRIAKMMDAETWMSARKAVELGFADEVLYSGGVEDSGEALIYSQAAVTNSLLDKIRQRRSFAQDSRIDAIHFHKRLELLKGRRLV